MYLFVIPNRTSIFIFWRKKVIIYPEGSYKKSSLSIRSTTKTKLASQLKLHHLILVVPVEF